MHVRALIHSFCSVTGSIIALPLLPPVHIRVTRRRLCIVACINPLTVLLSEVHRASNLPECARALRYDECTVR